MLAIPPHESAHQTAGANLCSVLPKAGSYDTVGTAVRSLPTAAPQVSTVAVTATSPPVTGARFFSSISMVTRASADRTRPSHTV